MGARSCIQCRVILYKTIPVQLQAMPRSRGRDDPLLILLALNERVDLGRLRFGLRVGDNDSAG